MGILLPFLQLERKKSARQTLTLREGLQFLQVPF